MNHPLHLPRALRTWLTCRGSLTQRLKTHCVDFGVRPVTTGVASPHPDEYLPLDLRLGALAYVRKVLLSCNQQNVVFAHSVLPCASLRGGWQHIKHLGARSLGTALFHDPHIQREALHYLRLDCRHALFHAAVKHHVVTGSSLWARRSVFRRHGHPLLVTEVFLPAIEQL